MCVDTAITTISTFTFGATATTTTTDILHICPPEFTLLQKLCEYVIVRLVESAQHHLGSGKHRVARGSEMIRMRTCQNSQPVTL
jgi:hypothetical protein